MKVMLNISDPKIQIKYSILLLIIAGGIMKLILAMDSNNLDISEPWIISCTILFVFILINIMFAFRDESGVRYWRTSVFGYIIIMVLSFLIATIISDLPISETRTYGWLYVVFTMGYLILLSIVQLIKRLVVIAQQDKR